MKILVLGSRIPYPQTDGGAIATYQTLKIYAQLNYDVTYFSFNTKKHFVSDQDIKQHLGFCKVIPVYLDASINLFSALWHLIRNKSYNLNRFNKPAAQQQLAALLQKQKYDVVHFESLFTTPFLPTVQAHFNGTIVLRQHNIEFKIWEKLAAASNGIKKWYLTILSKQLQKTELATLTKFKTIINISDQDTEYLNKLGISCNTISLATEQLKAIDNHNPMQLFHIGNMQWQPNYQGVMWFIKNCWPTMLAALPNAQFHIAGLGLNPLDPQLKAPNVINHGKVDNAHLFMQQHGIMVIPLQSASGLRVKALEAMAQGICTAGTSIGYSGLPVTNNQQAIIANQELQLAEQLIYLLQNPNQANKIGQNAYQWVHAHYSQAAIAKQWKQMIEKLSPKT